MTEDKAIAPLIPPVGEDDPLGRTLARIRALRPPCDKHKPLRFPMCGACQFDARLEEADAALTLTRQRHVEQIRVLTAQRDKWLDVFNRSEQFQSGPTTRAEAAESREAALRAELETAQQEILTIGEQKQALLAELKRRGAETETLKQEQAQEGPWTCRCGQDYPAYRSLCDLCGATRWWKNATVKQEQGK